MTLSGSAYIATTVKYIARTTGNRIDVQLFRPSGSIISGDSFYADAISLVSSVIPSGNVLANPSFEGSTSGWTASANATLAAITDASSPYRGTAAKLSLSTGTSAYSMSYPSAATKASWGDSLHGIRVRQGGQCRGERQAGGAQGGREVVGRLGRQQRRKSDDDQLERIPTGNAQLYGGRVE